MLEKNANASSAAPASAEASAARNEVAANLERALSHGSLSHLVDGSSPPAKRDTFKEETVEELLAKLASKGEDVKIVRGDEDAKKQEAQTAEMSNMQQIIQ